MSDVSWIKPDMLRGTPREATDVFAWPACSAFFFKKTTTTTTESYISMFPWFPMSYTFTRIYNEADTCCSSEQLEGALKERCAEVPRLLVHKPPETYYCSFDLNVTSAACCGGLKKKKRRLISAFFRRCKQHMTCRDAVFRYTGGSSRPFPRLQPANKTAFFYA